MPTLSLNERDALLLMSRGAKAIRLDDTAPWLLGHATLYNAAVAALITKGLLDTYTKDHPTFKKVQVAIINTKGRAALTADMRR